MTSWRLAALGHAEPEWAPAPGILARGKRVPPLIFPVRRPWGTFQEEEIQMQFPVGSAELQGKLLPPGQGTL